MLYFYISIVYFPQHSTSHIIIIIIIDIIIVIISIIVIIIIIVSISLIAVIISSGTKLHLQLIITLWLCSGDVMYFWVPVRILGLISLCCVSVMWVLVQQVASASVLVRNYARLMTQGLGKYCTRF